MKQKIISLVALLVLAASPAVALSGTVYADCGSDTSSKGQVLQGVGETGGNCDDSGVNSAVRTVVQILSLIVGIAAIIMIILSGFRYITSGGESGKVASAKNALIYALIGLVVAALAQLMVQFVLNRSSVATTCQYDAKLAASDPACKKKP